MSLYSDAIFCNFLIMFLQASLVPLASGLGLSFDRYWVKTIVLMTGEISVVGTNVFTTVSLIFVDSLISYFKPLGPLRSTLQRRSMSRSDRTSLPQLILTAPQLQPHCTLSPRGLGGAKEPGPWRSSAPRSILLNFNFCQLLNLFIFKFIFI